MDRKTLHDLLDTFLGRHSVQTLTREIRASIRASRPRSASREAVKVAAGRDTLAVMRSLGSKRRER